MVIETTAKQWVISRESADGKSPAQVARIATTENTKALSLQFDKATLKDAANGILLAPEDAKDLGAALIKAAEMASAPFTKTAATT